MKPLTPLAHSSAASLMCIIILIAGCHQAPIVDVGGGDVGRGKAAIVRYGCAACHSIPGITASNGNIGPPLAKIADRTYIGGVLANTPTNMMRWLRHPSLVDPRTAMPDLGISDAEAKDIAAYLYTLY